VDTHAKQAVAAVQGPRQALRVVIVPLVCSGQFVTTWAQKGRPVCSGQFVTTWAQKGRPVCSWGLEQLSTTPVQARINGSCTPGPAKAGMQVWRVALTRVCCHRQAEGAAEPTQLQRIRRSAAICRALLIRTEQVRRGRAHVSQVVLCSTTGVLEVSA